MYVVLLSRDCPMIGRQLLYTFGPYATEEAANAAAPALRIRCERKGIFGRNQVETEILHLFSVDTAEYEEEVAAASA